MSSKGITKDRIVTEAVSVLEASEQAVVSMHEVARRLDVKTPSLYKHIKNTNELHCELIKYAIAKFVDNQNAATEGLEKDDAIKAFADAYFLFAAENKGLYRLIMSMPRENSDVEKEIAVPLLETVVKILSGYGLEQVTIAHWQRVFRAILHGFISQEDAGYFYYYQDMSLKQSRKIAIQCFLDGLHEEIKKAQSKQQQ